MRNLPRPLVSLIFFGWILSVQLTGLGAFTKGFFLTRIELGRESQCELQSLLGEDEIQRLSQPAREQQRGSTKLFDANADDDNMNDGDEGCWLPQRFGRVVWIVIDALRYDFAAFAPPERESREGVGKPRYARGARHYLNHLPVIREAIGGGGPDGGDGVRSSELEGSAGVLFQFEADPPTVTMQRLKGLTTGGLPTFIDFRDNFHSPEIAEDNWVAQIRTRAASRKGGAKGKGKGKAKGKGSQLVFMGDDTWTSLYPTYFTKSYPFPSFNTRDLHTVDDGVLSHLSRELANDDWEVLVAHFLGVDHVGHTFGPASQAMADKLDQMDAALRTVFSSVDEDTVVFVLGDHGMTEDGNHGGATAEETGAALLIWSRSAERLFGAGFRHPPDRLHDNGPSAESHQGYGGEERKERSREEKEQRRGLGAFGLDEGVLGGKGIGDVGESIATPSSGRQVAQIDLVPTVSLLMGVPVPFGNLGGIIPEVFQGPYAFGGTGDGGGVGHDDPRFYERLCDALLVNSVQVWRYLNEYASVASLPKDDMFRLERLLEDARETHAEWRRRRQSRSGTPRDLASSAAELSRVCDLYREFLDASIELGRELWTQYDTGLMWWGLAVLLAAMLSLAARALAFSMQRRHCGGQGGEGCLRDEAFWTPGSGDDDMESAVFWSGSRGACAGVVGATLEGIVFGFNGFYVFASKVAICSAAGVCWSYAEAVLKRGWHTKLKLTATTAGISGRASCNPDAVTVPGLLSPESRDITATGLEGEATDTAIATVILTLILSVLYCAGLFSNSFIEAEDGLHRFLGSSSLLSLSLALYLQQRQQQLLQNSRVDSEPKDQVSTGTVSALYVALAAACLRTSAAAQESIAEAGVSTEATFGVVRSLLPLPALWCMCASARAWGPSGDASYNNHFKRVSCSYNFGFHGFVQALSLAAIGAYWVNEAAAAATKTADGENPRQAGSPAFFSVVDGVHFFSPFLIPRLFLPRAVYLLCAVGFAVALLRPARWRASGGDISGGAGAASGPIASQDSEPGSDSATLSYAHAVARTSATLVSHLLPVVVLILGAGSPEVVLLVAAACCFALRGISIAAGTGVAVPLGAAAVTWSIVGRAFFFLTGHHNQFSRLKYSAAFVGFDEFSFEIGGVLLFLNTFGTEILAALALPMLASAVIAEEQRVGDDLSNIGLATQKGTKAVRQQLQRPRNEAQLEEDTRSFDQPEAWEAKVAPIPRAAALASSATKTPRFPYNNASLSYPTEEAFLSAMERISGLILALSSVRTLLSAANISVQRGHLMLWAVFAPKFIFDATMQAVCGAAAVATWVTVLVAHRAFVCHHPSSSREFPPRRLVSSGGRSIGGDGEEAGVGVGGGYTGVNPGGQRGVTVDGEGGDDNAVSAGGRSTSSLGSMRLRRV